jgi:hypothetical protein
MEKNSKKEKNPLGGMRQKEGPLNKKVVQWLKNLPQCTAYKRKGGPANPGQLDVTGCLQGIRIEIEGKVGDNKPTKLQEHYIREWTEAGAITGWYNNFEDAQEIVRSGAARYNIKI